MDLHQLHAAEAAVGHAPEVELAAHVRDTHLDEIALRGPPRRREPRPSLAVVGRLRQSRVVRLPLTGLAPVLHRHVVEVHRPVRGEAIRRNHGYLDVVDLLRREELLRQFVSSTMYPSSAIPLPGSGRWSTQECSTSTPSHRHPSSRARVCRTYRRRRTRSCRPPGTSNRDPARRRRTDRSCSGDSGPVSCATSTTLSTPCNTKGRASPTGIVFSFVVEMVEQAETPIAVTPTVTTARIALTSRSGRSPRRAWSRSPRGSPIRQCWKRHGRQGLIPVGDRRDVVLERK